MVRIEACLAEIRQKIPVFPAKIRIFSGKIRIRPILLLDNPKRHLHTGFQVSKSKNGFRAHKLRETGFSAPPLSEIQGTNPSSTPA